MRNNGTKGVEVRDGSVRYVPYVCVCIPKLKLETGSWKDRRQMTMINGRQKCKRRRGGGSQRETRECLEKGANDGGRDSCGNPRPQDTMTLTRFEGGGYIGM